MNVKLLAFCLGDGSIDYLLDIVVQKMLENFYLIYQK